MLEGGVCDDQLPATWVRLVCTPDRGDLICLSLSFATLPSAALVGHPTLLLVSCVSFSIVRHFLVGHFAFSDTLSFLRAFIVLRGLVHTASYPFVVPMVALPLLSLLLICFLSVSYT